MRPLKRMQEKMKGYSKPIRKDEEYTDNNQIIHIHTNINGYVDFPFHRGVNRGDRFTWAKVDGNKLTVRKSEYKISEDYYKRIKDFCSYYGIDFDAIKPGESITVEDK